jgi:hypothetical protein
MRRSKTIWSLVSLTTTLAAGAVAYVVWRELWTAVMIGALIGAAVAASNGSCGTTA